MPYIDAHDIYINRSSGFLELYHGTRHPNLYGSWYESSAKHPCLLCLRAQINTDREYNFRHLTALLSVIALSDFRQRSTFLTHANRLFAEIATYLCTFIVDVECDGSSMSGSSSMSTSYAGSRSCQMSVINILFSAVSRYPCAVERNGAPFKTSFRKFWPGNFGFLPIFGFRLLLLLVVVVVVL